MNYGELKRLVKSIVFPSGEARSLVPSHNNSILDAIVDIQTWVECFQQDNTQIIPHCNTTYNCGLTVLEIPRGRVKRLSVIDLSEQEDTGAGSNIRPGVQKTVYSDNLTFGVADVGKTNTTTLTIRCAPNTTVKGVFSKGGTGTAITATCEITVTPVQGTEGDPFTVNPTLVTSGDAETLFEVGEEGGTFQIEIVQTITAMAGDIGQRIQNGSYLSMSVSYFPPAGLVTNPDAPLDWCGEIKYRQVDPCFIHSYLKRSMQCGTCLPISSFFAIPREFCGGKGIVPVPTDEGVPAGLPKLPLGHHYPQLSTDATCRAQAGFWAIERGKIFIAPWIQSTETVVIFWDGIKREWDDEDLVENDPKLIRAVEMYLRKDTASKHGDIIGDPADFEKQYNVALSDLIHECNEETRVRDCEPSHARGAQTSIASLFFNDRQQYTASCPSGQTGDSVTVTIPAESVGSLVSKADANQKALAQAKTQAEEQLDCVAPPITYYNTVQEFTATCERQSDDDPLPDGDAKTVVIQAGLHSSQISQAAADALALADAEEQAYEQLTCTFHNRRQEVTLSCPEGEAGDDVTEVIAEATADYDQEITNATEERQSQAQAFANSAAYNAAYNAAIQQLICDGEPVGFFNTAQIVNVTLTCGAGGGGLVNVAVVVTVPADVATGLTQNEANQKARTLGQQYAQLQKGAICALFGGPNPPDQPYPITYPT